MNSSVLTCLAVLLCVAMAGHAAVQYRPGEAARKTEVEAADGSYYCMTYAGTMFKFWPDEDRTELLGMNWDNGRYCGSVCMSPDERYLYYCPGSHGMGSFDKVPVVQYETATRTKKVLAFLGPYYREKYGYTLGGTFSVRLMPNGKSLFIVWNGRLRRGCAAAMMPLATRRS